MSYPSTVTAYSTKVNGQIIDASDVNNVQTDVTAIETFVGTISSAAGTLMYDVRAAASNGGGHVQTANKGGTGQTSFTKGDLFVASSSSVIAKLGIGADGQTLTADSNQAAGVKWSGVSTGINVTAGQNINLGQAVVVASGAVSSVIYQLGDNNTMLPRAAEWRGQTFTTSSITQTIPKVTLTIDKIGAPSGNLNVGLYATTATFPSSLLSNVSVVAAGIGTKGDVDFTFATPVAVTATTLYGIVVNIPSGDVSNTIQVYDNTSGGYGGGNALTSANSGGTWASISGTDAHFKVYEVQTIAGQGYLSNASVQGELTDNFIGFANGTTAQGSVVAINITTDSNQSSLVNGLTYYLSNTPGAISSVAGTVSRKIGLAVSSVQILVKFDNP